MESFFAWKWGQSLLLISGLWPVRFLAASVRDKVHATYRPDGVSGQLVNGRASLDDGLRLGEMES
jgi:hypothetical protein